MHWLKGYNAAGYVFYFNADSLYRIDASSVSGSTDWGIFGAHPTLGTLRLDGTYATQAEANDAVTVLVGSM